MSVRVATVEDVDEIVRLGIEFHAKTIYKTPVDKDTLVDTIILSIAQGCCHVIERGDTIVGALLGVVVTHWWNRNIGVGHELFWYIRPGHRGGSDAIRAMRMFEAAAKAHGASEIHVASTTTLKPKSVGLTYARIGYKAADIRYSKEV